MSNGNPARNYRVVQWATGNIGQRAMKTVIEHPRMTLVGVWVHSEDKAGRDAGELCGLDRKIGVKATRDIDEILALRPDCVVYMPQIVKIDDVCRLLESGANVVTSVVEFHHPDSLEPDVRARVEDACRRGGSSLHSTGSSPGVITEALPLILCTLQRRLDFLTIDQYADLSERDSPTLIFDLLSWGKKPADFKERQRKNINDSFGHSFRLMAESLAMPLDRIETSNEHATARVRTKIAAGVLEPGTVAASRVTVTGYRGECPAMRFRAYFYAAADVEQDWDLRPTGVRIQVEGDAPVNVDVTFPIPAEDYRKVTPGLTAHPVVNAIPAVCAAAPGIRTAVELQVFPVFG